MFKFRLYKELKSEVQQNQHLKIKVFFILFRLSQLRRNNVFYSITFLPIHVLYFLYSNFLLNIEIPIATNIMSPLIIWHGSGIVVNPLTEIGRNVTLRNGVVIGNDGRNEGAPVIEEGAMFGANAVAIGPILIGKNAKIGPCAFVNFDVKEEEVVISTTLKK